MDTEVNFYKDLKKEIGVIVSQLKDFLLIVQKSNIEQENAMRYELINDFLPKETNKIHHIFDSMDTEDDDFFKQLSKIGEEIIGILSHLILYLETQTYLSAAVITTFINRLKAELNRFN